jgi:arylsulfatase A
MITTLYLIKSRRRFIFFAHFVFLFVMLLFVTKAGAQTQPNIIFILGDDIGYRVPQVNGGKSYNTPNLNQMAKNGMNFTECHSAPLCSPSRVLLLTGKYNFRNYTAWGILDTSQKTIANMLKNAGYKTACFGKWQLGGGDASIRKFGFDNYCVWSPDDSDYYGYRYKNPILYTNGALIPASLTQNKYGEDIVADSVMNFIERNKTVPFFVYYPMLLAHPPFQPTPDDADFASWSYPLKTDTAYYPSMIEYMDKKIGQIINKVKELDLQNNTVIIYAGDNGTPAEILEYTNTPDTLIPGGKGLTTENGTLVPMMIEWKGTIKPGSTNNDLIGFIDFLPTLAHIANIPVPADYGPLDGVDFYARLKDNKETPREWLFCDYNAHPGTDTLRRWAQTKEYKLYDTSLYSSTRLFYNIKKDPNELNPISPDLLTAGELVIKQKLLKVINGYVKQGVPILANADIISISDSSAILEDSVQTNGGSTIKAIGAVWSKKPNPELSSSPHSSDGIIAGPFQTLIKKLTANSIYYARVYAKNIAGISYSNEIKFRTLLNAPVAFAATSVNENGFVAHWHSINAATAYKLDVSTKPLFANIVPSQINQQFNNGTTPPPGWTYIGNIGINDTIHNALSPALQFKATNARVITKRLKSPASKLRFWIKAIHPDASSTFTIEGFNGRYWKTITIIQPLPTVGTTLTFDSASPTPLENNFIQFRFTYKKIRGGALTFDNVIIKYNKITPSFVQGYDGFKMSDTSFTVTGLKPSTNYYYRVRAVNNNNHSDNSNAIAVITCSFGNCDDKPANDFFADVFPNPTSGAFTLKIKGNSKTNTVISVVDAYDKIVYQSSGSNSYTFGKEFSPGIYFVKLEQGENSKTFKLIKEK